MDTTATIQALLLTAYLWAGWAHMHRVEGMRKVPLVSRLVVLAVWPLPVACGLYEGFKTRRAMKALKTLKRR